MENASKQILLLEEANKKLTAQVGQVKEYAGSLRNSETEIRNQCSTFKMENVRLREELAALQACSSQCKNVLRTSRP